MSKNKSENRNVNSTKNRKYLVRKLANNTWFFCYSFTVIIILNILQKFFPLLSSFNEYGIYTFAVASVLGILFVGLAANRNNDTETYN